MAVYVSNIIINCGADFRTIFELEDVITNSTTDLTNKIVKSQLRKHYQSKNAVNFEASIVGNPLYGKVQVSLASSITANLKGGRYLYDVVLEDSLSGEKTRIVEGSALVREGVTT